MRYYNFLFSLLTLFLGACNSNEKEISLDELATLLSQKNDVFDQLELIKKHEHIIKRIDRASVHCMLKQLADKSNAHKREAYFILLTLRKDNWDRKATELLVNLYTDENCDSVDFCSTILWINSSELVPIGNSNVKRLINSFLSDSNLDNKNIIMEGLFLIGSKFSKSKPLIGQLALSIIEDKKKQYDGYQKYEARSYLGIAPCLEDIFE